MYVLVKKRLMGPPLPFPIEQEWDKANKFSGPTTDAADSGDFKNHWARVLDQESMPLKSQEPQPNEVGKAP